VAFLKRITFSWDKAEQKDRYPYNIPSLARLGVLNTDHNVIYFIGENGTGKSTLLEALAFKCGFGNRGGGKYSIFEDPDNSLKLESIISLSWMPKVNNGFFLRAETFFDFANYIDELARDPDIGVEKAYAPYGDKSLHEQSHGEAFLTLFTHRFRGRGLYLLDEPEAALSPQRQLAFLRIIRDLEQAGKAQFIIATHSPILMAYPNAFIYSFDDNTVRMIKYEETDHYQLTKAFLNDRDRFLQQLFEN
jgi:predicted ATPase